MMDFTKAVKMNSTKNLYRMLGVLLCASLSGCADFEPPAQEGLRSASHTQAIMVTPEFAILGLEDVPAELFLTELGLSISEIRLQPVMSSSSGIAYSTSESFRLAFDVANGEDVKRLKPIEFPEAGRFVVSIRLEPCDKGNAKIPSLSLAGFVAGEGAVHTDPRAGSGEKFDGNPLPLPFEPKKDENSEDSDWTPFHYNSQRAVFYTFSDVELAPGEQTLNFTFDIQDWAVELIEPIVRAVRNVNGPDFGDGQGVDVTLQLESSGWGAEALMDSASVRTEPARPLPTSGSGR